MYGLSIRKKVIELWSDGRTLKEIGDFLKIHVRTLQYWVKRFELEGTIAPKTHTSRCRKLNKEELLSFVSEHSDKTLKEIGRVFQVSHVAIFKSLKKMSVTLKKRR